MITVLAAMYFYRCLCLYEQSFAIMPVVSEARYAVGGDVFF